jgi:hypothetical protein
MYKNIQIHTKLVSKSTTGSYLSSFTGRSKFNSFVIRNNITVNMSTTHFVKAKDEYELKA